MLDDEESKILKSLKEKINCLESFWCSDVNYPMKPAATPEMAIDLPDKALPVPSLFLGFLSL
jgi:hypothetical protein